jgi:FLVCR family MFS transporter 7
MAGCWIGLIFAVRPHNEIPIYVLAGLIGMLGFLLLPVGLELGCEVTRNAEVSSAILWMSGNLWTLIFVIGESIVQTKVNITDPPYSF